MTEIRARVPPLVIVVIVVLIAVTVAGELVLLLLEELVNLVVDITQTTFMFIYEKAFGLPYEKAQGRAAWSSLGLLSALSLVAAWRLTPSIKRASTECRQWYRERRVALSERWRSARWYQKLSVLAGGLAILSLLALVI
jgi:uncharacterized membrane protein